MGLFKIFKKKEKKIDNNTYMEGLSKTRETFWGKLFKNKYEKINEETLEELEIAFIEAGLGARISLELIDKLKDRIKKDKVKTSDKLLEIVADELIKYYGEENISFDEKKVYLFVGVNGTGKTTSMAKLAKQKIDDGKKVLLVAGDTFRAGAYEQTKIWADRIGASFYGKKDAKDPASIVFDALDYAKEKEIDIVMVDTAGRLQNKDNLMKELEKIKRIINSKIDLENLETLLVLDVTTGNNAMSQAEEFKRICDIDGIILTKVDGTSKGGIVISIKKETGLPVKYLGFGEKSSDLKKFELDNYIKGIFGDI